MDAEGSVWRIFDQIVYLQWASKTKKKEKAQQENIEVESKAKPEVKKDRIEQRTNLANDEEKIHEQRVA